MKKLIYPGIFVLLLTVCCKRELNDSLFLSDKPFDIKSGESKYNSDFNLTLHLDSVFDDSRCPKNVLCPWAGNAEARFVFSEDNTNVKFVLNTLHSFRTDTLINGFRIELVNLYPNPEIGRLIQQDEYRAEIKITKE